MRALPEISVSTLKDPAPLRDQEAPVLDTPCQTTTKTGTQPHPLAERLPKIKIKSQTAQYTPPATHQKDKIQPHSPEHRHQSPPPGSLHNPLNQPYQLGADTKNNRKTGTTNLQPAKRRPQDNKLSKMRRQRNMQQMKEQSKKPPDQTNEEEIGSLPEKELRVMIVKMIQNLGNRMEKIQETFNKDLQELKNKQTMMNNTINEIKNSLEEINIRITEAEERISDLEDKIV